MATDKTAEMLGIRQIQTGTGQAAHQMAVRNDMLNMHDTCHGGVIFTLAAVAFAKASNSYGNSAVIHGANIDYIEPAYKGDKLTAVSHTRAQRKRTGIFDIEIRNQTDTLIALFIGKSFSIRQSHKEPQE
jgi:acyl-CoA thioesterase